jgi:hypothetical protein
MTQASIGSERSFGLSVGGVFALLAGWSVWKGHVLRTGWFGAIAALLILPALAYPPLLRLPHRLWWRLAGGLGWVNSRILLSGLFFLIFTPTGLAMRLTGWDPMRRRRPSGTGWTNYSPRQHDPKHYDRMF